MSEHRHPTRASGPYQSLSTATPHVPMGHPTRANGPSVGHTSGMCAAFARHACWMRIGACDLMSCQIHVFMSSGLRPVPAVGHRIGQGTLASTLRHCHVLSWGGPSDSSLTHPSGAEVCCEVGSFVLWLQILPCSFLVVMACAGGGLGRRYTCSRPVLLPPTSLQDRRSCPWLMMQGRI